MDVGLKKYSNYFTALGLILWYIGGELERCSDYLTGFRLVFWYIGLGDEKHLDYSDSDWFYYTMDLDWLNQSTKQNCH